MIDLDCPNFREFRTLVPKFWKSISDTGRENFSLSELKKIECTSLKCGTKEPTVTEYPFRSGRIVGDRCIDLCSNPSKLSILDCQTNHLGKPMVASGLLKVI